MLSRDLRNTITKLKENDQEVISIQTVNTLSEFNRTHSIEIVANILDNNTAELSQISKEDHLIRNLIVRKFNSVTEQLLLNLGFFSGVHFVVNLLIHEKEKRRKDTTLIRSYLDRKHTRAIFMYLFRNPTAGHKELAKELSLSPSGLNGVLKELINSHLIEKTEHSKYSYYSLSEEAYRFTKDEIVGAKRQPLIIFENIKETTSEPYSYAFFEKPCDRIIDAKCIERTNS